MGGINGFIGASLIAVYMFSGWDTGILVNEETSDAREKPGQSVVTSVIVLTAFAVAAWGDDELGQTVLQELLEVLDVARHPGHDHPGLLVGVEVEMHPAGFTERWRLLDPV